MVGDLKIERSSFIDEISKFYSEEILPCIFANFLGESESALNNDFISFKKIRNLSLMQKPITLSYLMVYIIYNLHKFTFQFVFQVF